jgi:hypothetical protein
MSFIDDLTHPTSSSLTSGISGQIAGSLIGNPFGGVTGSLSPRHAIDRIFGSGTPDNSASTELANIAASQWADYQSTFVPLENVLVQRASNPDYAGRLASASKDVQSSFNAADKSATDRLHSYGLEMTPGQKQSYARSSNLDRGLADVEAQNSTRAAIRGEQMMALTGTGAGAGVSPGVVPAQTIGG